MPLISTRAGASSRGFSHMASSILPGFNNDSALAVGHGSSPFITVYKFNDVTGYGTKYANPSTTLPSQATGIAFSLDNSIIAIASNYYLAGVSVYPWNSTTGFGTRYAAPSTVVSWGSRVSINPSKTAIALSSEYTPWVHAYEWSSSGFGTKYSSPSTLPGGWPGDIIFNPAGNVVVTTSPNSPFIFAYAWSSSGFGTKYANPSTLIYSGTTGGTTRLAFSPAGDTIAMSNIFPGVYAWSSSGFGTMYANPSNLSTSTGGVKFNPAGDVILFTNTSNGLATYDDTLIAFPWSSSTGFGTKYARVNPSAFTTSGYDVDWNPTGTAVVMVSTFYPYIHAYSWYNGPQSKYAQPVSLPPNQSTAVAFSN